MLDANQAHIALAIPAVDTELQVLAFTGREMLNKPYCFDIDLVSPRADLDRKVEVRANDHLTVAATLHSKIGTGLFIEAGNEIHYKAGSKVVIDAGMELTANGGGSFLKLDPSGVTLSGATIKMNSGGGPGSGSGLKILMPVIPGMADSDRAGNLLERATAGEKLAPPKGICLEYLRKAMREGNATLAGVSA